MEKVKIKNIKTGVIKEVKKSLAGEYIGTGEYKVVEKKKQPSFTTKEEK